MHVELRTFRGRRDGDSHVRRVFACSRLINQSTRGASRAARRCFALSTRVADADAPPSLTRFDVLITSREFPGDPTAALSPLSPLLSSPLSSPPSSSLHEAIHVSIRARRQLFLYSRSPTAPTRTPTRISLAGSLSVARSFVDALEALEGGGGGGDDKRVYVLKPLARR